MPEKILHVEPVNGGLVTARDPSLLLPGELQQCDEMFYKPGSPSLFKAPSRASWATSLGAAVKGLVYCAFDFITVDSILTSGAATINANTTTGASFANLTVGAEIVGEGFPANTTVQTYNSTVQVVASNAATRNGPALLQFRSEPLLVAMANSKYQVAVANNTTGTPADLEAISEGTTLDSVHFENTHVLLNGSNVNRVLYPDKTLGPHGMQPAEAKLNVTTSAGGSWVLTDGIGVYGYWYTEWDDTHKIESAFSGKATAIEVTALTQRVIVTQPSLRANDTTTHWKLYRTPKLTYTTVAEAEDNNCDFPVGEYIGMQIFNTTTPTVFNDDGAAPTAATLRNAGGVWLVDGTGWANTANLVGIPDTTYCTRTAGALGISGSVYDNIVRLNNFGITGVTDPVTGILVTLYGVSHATNPGRFAVRPNSLRFYGGVDRGRNTFEFGAFVASGNSNIVFREVATTSSNTTYTIGGSSDRWYWRADPIEWQAVDFSNGNFFLDLGLPFVGPNGVVSIDAVGVTVYYGNNQQKTTLVPYPYITLKPAGVEIKISRKSPPPKARMGEYFQSSLVTNDENDRTRIRYSFQGDIHAFPSEYYLDYGAGQQDIVTSLDKVGHVLVVGCTNHLYRTSSLPREADAEFERGRAVDEIEANHGVVAPDATALFTFNGQQALAYVSNFGLHRTDGYSTDTLTDDLNWERLIEPSYLNQCFLVNNPKYYELLFFYVPKGGTTVSRMLRLNYHPQHIKEGGKLKISGPCTVAVRCGTAARLNSGEQLLFTGSNATGTIYLENSGSVTTGTPRTRQMYLEGVGNEWKLDDVYIHGTLFANETSSPFNLTITPTLAKTNSTSRTGAGKVVAVPANPGSDTYPQDGKLLKVIPNESGNAADLKVEMGSSADGYAVDYIVVARSRLGKES